MKKSVKRAIQAAILVYLVLFAGFFVAELVSVFRSPQDVFGFDNMVQNSMPSSRSKANYASEKIVIAQGGGSQVVDQKYERVASVRLSSPNFEKDNEEIRALARKADAVIQSENVSGLPGSRVLSLKLGVVPEAFDATVEAFSGIARLRGIEIVKSDRTAEYRALEASRLSLEKTRDGLKSLRTAGADLSDLVALETKILEIEGQIQDLGVSLGDYSEQNSFCTISLSLVEQLPPAALEILAAAFGALGMALLAELGIAVVLLCAVATAALGLFVWDKIRLIRQRED